MSHPGPKCSGIWGPLYKGGELQIIELCKYQLGKPGIFLLQTIDPYNFIFHMTHHLHRDYLQDNNN